MKRVSVFAIKGGIGKTTVTLLLGLSLAAIGRKVLLVDQDLNSDLSYRLLGEDLNSYSMFNKTKYGIGSMVFSGSQFMPVNLINNLDLIPMEPDTIIKADQRLIISQLKIPESKYDYVIFDTPPSYDSVVAEAIMKNSDYIYSIITFSAPVIRTLLIELQKLIPLLTSDLRSPPKFVGLIRNKISLTQGEELKVMIQNMETICNELPIPNAQPCIFNTEIPMRGRIFNYDKIRTYILTLPLNKLLMQIKSVNAIELANEFEKRIGEVERL